jgi:hypothetical protein
MVARPKCLGLDVVAKPYCLKSGAYNLHNFREPAKGNGFVEDQNTHANVLNGLKASN